MYPARDTLQHVIKAWWKVAWQKREKYCQVLPVFFFVNEHNNTNTKPKAKKQRFLKLSKKFPEEKQQLVEENDADNIRKVLCKSLIQWFWELNLCCYKYRVDCLGSLRLFLCCCWNEFLKYNKTLNVRSLGKTKLTGFPRDLTLSVLLYL